MTVRIESEWGDLTIEVVAGDDFVIGRYGVATFRLTPKEARDLAMVLIGATSMIEKSRKAK